MGLSQGLRIIAEGETSQEREDNVINPTLIARGSLPCIVSHVLYASQSGNVSSRSTWTRKPTKSPSPSRCCRGCPSGSESVPPFRLLSEGAPWPCLAFQKEAGNHSQALPKNDTPLPLKPIGMLYC